MPAKYKKKCPRCRTNYVTVTWRNKNVVCYECQKKDMQGEITDPKMKKLFDIPEEFFKDNAFLRNIKIGYLRWGKLTDRQVEAFEKTVAKMKEEAKKPKEDIKFDEDI